MTFDSPFTADHHGFYLNGKNYDPSGARLVRLAATLSDDLDWATEKENARRLADDGQSILWEIDLGLSSFLFNPEDSAAFFSFSIAIEEFTQSIWPAFHQTTFGIALYRGSLPSEKQFPLSLWESVLANRHDLGRIQLLSEYLHRLISFLPETVLPFAFFDTAALPMSAKALQLLSKARFEHIHLGLKETHFPFSELCWDDQGVSRKPSHASVGLYLPNDDFLDNVSLHQLDQILDHLEQKNIPYRIVPEEKLTEQWDGLEKLIIPANGISKKGKRKLLGFIAAGGLVTNEEGEEVKFS